MTFADALVLSDLCDFNPHPYVRDDLKLEIE